MACGGGSDGLTGTAPEVRGINFYNSEGEASILCSVGETGSIVVYISDQDKDIVKIQFDEYVPFDAEYPIKTTTIDLSEPMDAVEKSYSISYTGEPPTGTWLS